MIKWTESGYIAIFILILLPIDGLAVDIFVSTPVTAKTLNNAIASANPGDVVIIPDGAYSSTDPITIPIYVDGTKDSPITLKAQSPGGVTFSGEVKGGYFMRIRSKYWIIRDFQFSGISKIGDAHTYGLIVDADHVRITNNYFEKIANLSTRTHSWAIWIAKYADANYCRIDNNTMTDSKAKFIHNATDTNVHTGKYTKIDHNYITNPHAKAMSYLHLGTGGSVANESIDSFITVEYNLFENHDGPGEPIDDKSSSNTIRYNVFRSKGGRIQDKGVVLRGGDGTLVERNYFFNVGEHSVRVHGSGHTIKHNYFENPGYSAILLAEGGTHYANVSDILIENNSIINPGARGIYIGWWLSGDIKPENLIFKKNKIVSSIGNIIRDEGHTGSFFWENNVHYATGSAKYWVNAGGVPEPNSGIIKANPDSPPKGIYIPPDIGSDLFKDFIPINESQVGVSWLRKKVPVPAPAQLHITS